jgi:predicted dehydrogenase
MRRPPIVVVGAGAFGKNHVRTFSELDALFGVVDQDEELLSKVTRDYPGTKTWADLDKALLDITKAAFVISTPAPTHFELARQVLEKGHDVLVEKPITLSSKEAKILNELAQSNGAVLMAGHLLLFQPFLSWFKEELETGRLGAIKRVSTQRSKLGTVRSGENVWWSFAPHDIAVVLELLGRPELSSVNAHGSCTIQNNVEDDVHVELGFDNGTSAHIHSSWLWPDNIRRTTVICENKMLVYDEVANSVTIYNSKIDGNLFHHPDPSPKTITLPEANFLELECKHFLSCIENRSTPIPNGQNGLDVVKILEKAHKLL